MLMVVWPLSKTLLRKYEPRREDEEWVDTGVVQTVQCIKVKSDYHIHFKISVNTYTVGSKVTKRDNWESGLSLLDSTVSL